MCVHDNVCAVQFHVDRVDLDKRNHLTAVRQTSNTPRVSFINSELFLKINDSCILFLDT
jgi:hypothetical protein